MRKEVFIAIILGAILGVVVAFGVWRTNNVINGKKTPSIVKNNQLIPQTQSPKPSPVATSGITIVKPNKNEVITSSSVLITGIAQPNSWVVIDTAKKDYIARADASGSFAKEVALSEGINLIQINDTKLQVISTSPLSSPSPSPAPSGTADSIRQKVQEKLDVASTKPVAFIGSVSDKTQSGIEITSMDGDILQGSVNAGTTFIREKPTAKTIEFEDLAIGDFVIVIGYNISQSLIDARRVSVTTAPGALTTKAYFGNISNSSKKDLVITSTNQASFTFLTPTNTTIALAESGVTKKLADLTEAVEVAVVASASGNSLSSETIFIISSKSTPKPSPTP